MQFFKSFFNLKSLTISLFFFATFLFVGNSNLAFAQPLDDCVCVNSRCTAAARNGQACVSVDTSTQNGIGFQIPTLSTILTFAIRAFFIIAGLAALVFLLLGALAWVTSGGDKENVSKAQSKITNAIIGVILVAVVLAVIVTLEQVVFAGKICLGLSCPITIPSLLK